MTRNLTENQQKNLRALPALATLLTHPEMEQLSQKFTENAVKFFARAELEAQRQKILETPDMQALNVDTIVHAIAQQLERRTDPSGRRAINATGILLHTGLGRAPLARHAKEQLEVFDGYSILQTDIMTGERSVREEFIEKMLIDLTGCEAATVVNNNAAATMLILNTLAQNKEAVISRGQLVEIGGAFRIPEVMEQSRAILREVGATNRTHLKDYKNALNENTGAILHVHTSNYRIRGFASAPDIKELCELRDAVNPSIPVIDDLGSGSLVPLSQFGISDEPLIRNSIAAGVDVCSFSGDKLICGPQAGIICGKKVWIEQIRKNPFMRMFRVCKMTLAVLEATLMEFVKGTWDQEIPLYQMLLTPLDELEVRAQKCIAETHQHLETLGYACEMAHDFAYMGSGSIPDEGIPSVVMKITPNAHSTLPVHVLALKLRAGVPSVFARIAENAVLFDMRTLSKNDLNDCIKALNSLS